MGIERGHNGRKQRTPNFEWRHGETEGDWKQPISQPGEMADEATKTPSSFNRRILQALSIVLILLVGVGGWLWHKAQTNLDATEKEVGNAVAGELFAAVNFHREITTGPSTSNVQTRIRHQDVEEIEALAAIDAQTPNVNLTTTKVRLLHLEDDIAVAEMVMQLAADAPAYRQTRVYRYDGSEWQRTEPSTVYWQPRQMESRYFVFHYYTLDADSITQAASALDTIYPTLYTSFFTHATSQEKLEIVIEPRSASLQQPATSVEKQSHRITIPSPSLSLTPVNVSNVDALTQALALALVDELIHRLRTAHNPETLEEIHLQPLLDGVRLWQLWSANLPLAAWRKPVVQWVYSKDGKSPIEFSHVEPDPCAITRLWLSSTLDPQTLLLCNGKLRVERAIAWRLLYPPPAKLQELSLWANDQSPHPALSVALATVVEYAATAYGRDRIPLLIADYGKYDNWERLIPALFGVSVADFEKGWHEYLSKRYEVTFDF